MANIIINDTVAIPEDASIAGIENASSVELRGTTVMYGERLSWDGLSPASTVPIISITTPKADGITVFTSHTAYISRIEFSGTNASTWWVELWDDSPASTGIVAKKYIHYGIEFNSSFDFQATRTDGLEVPPGWSMKVYVSHSRSDVGDFHATLYGRYD